MTSDPIAAKRILIVEDDDGQTAAEFLSEHGIPFVFATAFGRSCRRHRIGDKWEWRGCVDGHLVAHATQARSVRVRVAALENAACVKMQ